MNNQQRLLSDLVKEYGQVPLAEALKCTPQFICNIRRGKANLPLKMWRKLVLHGVITRVKVYDCLTADYSNDITRVLCRKVK